MDPTYRAKETIEKTPRALAAETQRRSAAYEVLDYTDRTAARAGRAAEELEGRLSAVVSPGPPNGPREGEATPYPPLFANLHEKLLKINGALDTIESLTARTEL